MCLMMKIKPLERCVNLDMNHFYHNLQKIVFALAQEVSKLYILFILMDEKYVQVDI